MAPEEAIARLIGVEAATSRNSPWLAAAVLAVSAAALAALLGADSAAVATAGLSTAMGLVIRQGLHRRRYSLLALPFAAAFVGGVAGSVAIRFGWTHTPELALIVPCLMLIPGPHLINGLLDLVDNYIPMSLARLGLAAGILLAACLGLLVGVEFVFPALPEATRSFEAARLGVVADMLLAAAVTAGFAVYYNTPWPQLGLAMMGGALGHGLRTLALEFGLNLEGATFLGGFAVGAISSWIARAKVAPVAVVAFAGAVTMMPGLQMFGALYGAVCVTRLQSQAELPAVTAVLANAVQAATVVAALGLGLIIATRTIHALARRPDSQ
jgi:uncharacterized membrane protein YjjB (DUF3815 family)